MSAPRLRCYAVPRSLAALAAVRGCIRFGYVRALLVEADSRAAIAALRPLFGGDLPPKTRAARCRDRRRWGVTNFVLAPLTHHRAAVVFTNAASDDDPHLRSLVLRLRLRGLRLRAVDLRRDHITVGPYLLRVVGRALFIQPARREVEAAIRAIDEAARRHLDPGRLYRRGLFPVLWSVARRFRWLQAGRAFEKIQAAADRVLIDAIARAHRLKRHHVVNRFVRRIRLRGGDGPTAVFVDEKSSGHRRPFSLRAVRLRVIPVGGRWNRRRASEVKIGGRVRAEGKSSPITSEDTPPALSQPHSARAAAAGAEGETGTFRQVAPTRGNGTAHRPPRQIARGSAAVADRILYVSPSPRDADETTVAHERRSGCVEALPTRERRGGLRPASRDTASDEQACRTSRDVRVTRPAPSQSEKPAMPGGESRAGAEAGERTAGRENARVDARPRGETGFSPPAGTDGPAARPRASLEAPGAMSIRVSTETGDRIGPPARGFVPGTRATGPADPFAGSRDDRPPTDGTRTRIAGANLKRQGNAGAENPRLAPWGSTPGMVPSPGAKTDDRAINAREVQGHEELGDEPDGPRLLGETPCASLRGGDSARTPGRHEPDALNRACPVLDGIRDGRGNVRPRRPAAAGESASPPAGPIPQTGAAPVANGDGAPGAGGSPATPADREAERSIAATSRNATPTTPQMHPKAVVIRSLPGTPAGAWCCRRAPVGPDRPADADSKVRAQPEGGRRTSPAHAHGASSIRAWRQAESRVSRRGRGSVGRSGGRREIRKSDRAAPKLAPGWQRHPVAVAHR